MKKIFSLLLTVALLLSAVAFPAMVSAAGETVTLSFVAKKDGNVVDAIYPGDTITVDLVATADAAITTSAANAYFTYDATKLTKTDVSGLNETTAGAVSYVNDQELDITTEGVVLGTITLKVADNAAGTTSFKVATNNPASFIVGSGADLYQAANAAEAKTLTIASNSGKAQILVAGEYQDIPTSGATYNDAEKLTVKAVLVGNTTATITGPELEDVALTAEGMDLNAAGTYTITVTPVGGDVATYTFTFAKFLVDAQLAIAAPSDESYADGYIQGETFVMPVSISGLGEATASMVKFSVTYDKTAVSLTVPEEGDIAYEGEAGEYTIAYNKNVNDEDLALANNAVVEELEFKANADAAFGSTTVTIEALDLALVTTVVDPTASEIGTAQATASVTIVPNDAFATVSGAAEAYTNVAYAVAVAPKTNATAKVYYSVEVANTEDLATLYTAGAELSENSNFTVDNSGYFYVITKIGTAPAVYELSATVESKFDNVAPAITPVEGAENWTSTISAGFTLAIAATADGAAHTGYEWATSAAAETFTSVTTTDKIEIPVGTSAEKIYVKAVDAAGNKSEATEVVVKLDSDAPTAAVAAGTQSEGKVALTITTADSTSGVKSVFVMKDGELAQDVTAVEGYAYTATASGTYTVVVTDNAGNETTSNEAIVTITQAAVLPIKVAINAEKATVENGFAAGGVNNGTFMYVKIEKQDDVSGYTTTYTLNDVEAVFTENTLVLTGEAGEYTLVTTTTNNVDASDVATATYKFSIAASQADMKSVDANAYFNAFDFAHLRRLTATANGDAVAADAAFTGGLLSADVNADMGLTAADAAAILKAMRDVEYVGTYNFAIMNGVKDEGAALE